MARDTLALALLISIVAVILWAERQKQLRRFFRWLPIPLWCYTLPMVAIAIHGLPDNPHVYKTATAWLLPFALACLLLGADLPAVARLGWKALAAAVIGAAGILTGAIIGVVLLHQQLPGEAWKGASALAATWTGGTLNLVAMQSLLHISDAVFAPLIVVDAVIAYGWMALLVGLSAREGKINQWLGIGLPDLTASTALSPALPPQSLIYCSLLVAGLTSLSYLIAPILPVSSLISSQSGWVVLLITTLTLCCSLIPWVRAQGQAGTRIGYPCLYLVLAATGAQAHLGSLSSVPLWIVLGLIVAATHAIFLLITGRLLKIPLGLLATASQANIGGVVSAPLVGAVYNQSLVPVGLVLAMAGNALGTYLGLLTASLIRTLLHFSA